MKTIRFWTILTFVSGCSFDYEQLRGHGYGDGGIQSDTQPRADVEPDTVKDDTKVEPDSGAEAAQTEVGPDSPPAVPCTILPQGGCKAGERCVYDTTMTGCAPPVCAPAGTGTQEADCNSASRSPIGDCAVGYTCSAIVGGGTAGRCRMYCRTTADCTAGGTCSMALSCPGGSGRREYGVCIKYM